MKISMDFISGLSNEDRLLLACARVCPEEERSELIKRLVKEDIDWNRLHRNALRHGLGQLLYWHLNAVVPAKVPDQIMGQMREQFRKTALTNLHLAGELIRLTDLFKENGIEAIPFKGPLLAADLYGNLALRPFSDIDLLVRKEDLRYLAELFYSRGYRPAHGLDHVIKAANRLPLYMLTPEIVFISENNGFMVDVHLSIAKGNFAGAIDADRLRNNCVPVTLVSRIIHTFQPEDLLLFMCVHGGKHFWESVLWISDVAMFIKTHVDIQWAIIFEQAENNGSRRMLFLGLALARELLGAVLPENVSQKVEADTVVTALVEQVTDENFNKITNGRMTWKKFSQYLMIWEKPIDKGRFCLHLLMFPHTKDFYLVHLPTLLFFLYFLFRPVRLIFKHGPLRLTKYLFRRPE